MPDISTQILDTAKARPGLAQICPHDSSCGQIKKGPALRTQILDTLKVIILASAVVLSVQYVFAWTGPPGNPPPDPCPAGQPGCDPPVNVGPNVNNVGQSKIGGFSAASLGALVLNIADTDGNTDITLIGDTGITVADGDITATNGAVKGVSLENNTDTGGIDSSGNVKGASFSVGSTEVISSSKVGTFSGGVTVGTSNATIEYLGLDRSQPFAIRSDCNTIEEAGRIYFDSQIGVIYVCIQGRSVTADEPAPNGWKIVNVKYN